MKILTTLLITAIAAATMGCAPAQNRQDVVTTSDLSPSEKYRLEVARSARVNNANVQWVNPPSDEDVDEHYDDG